MARSTFSRVGLVAILVVAMFCVGWVTARQPAHGFEYEVVELHAPQSHAQNMLNQRGEYGWELVAVTTVPNSDSVYYYLKRVK